jgi:thiamine biosynthesis lipoprotein
MLNYKSKTTENAPPVLLFDGVCNLCNASVQWVIRRDQGAVFRFAALQSEAGQALLEKHRLPTNALDTVVLVDGGKAYIQSDVPLKICQKLGGWWRLAVVFFVIPKPVRNAVYDWIARNRYRWFGRQESCMMPTPALRSRFLLLLPLVFFFACHSVKNRGENQETLSRYEYSEPHMGTGFRIVQYAASEALAHAAAKAAFARIHELDSIFSNYREDSEVGRLSAGAGANKPVKISPELWEVLRYADSLSQLTNGAFDVTVGPLTKLWRRAFRQKQFPAMQEIEAAKAKCGYRHLYLHDDHSVTLGLPGMALDLGAVAKGFAVDEALETLASKGVFIALVDGGGDLRCTGPPPGKRGWLIERFYYKRGKLATKKSRLSNVAIATSGDTYRYLEWEGKRYSHILDPRTGMGVTSRKIVSVTAPTCMEADAWATALSVGNQAALIEKLRSFPAIRFQSSGLGEADGEK